jgi:hypothetical protein
MPFIFLIYFIFLGCFSIPGATPYAVSRKAHRKLGLLFFGVKQRSAACPTPPVGAGAACDGAFPDAMAAQPTAKFKTKKTASLRDGLFLAKRLVADLPYVTGLNDKALH